MIDYKKYSESLESFIESLIILPPSLDDDVIVNESILQNDNCPEFILRRFVSKLPQYVLPNNNCPIEFIEEAINGDVVNNIRYAIQNKNCPIEALNKFAKHKDYYFREGVVLNENCPIDILRHLSSDEDDFVKEIAQTKLMAILNLESFK